VQALNPFCLEATMAGPDLVDPFQPGPLLLPNRIVMAPFTRNRASADNVPRSVR
jgi:N-ethylmaleimide reductase